MMPVMVMPVVMRFSWCVATIPGSITSRHHWQIRSATSSATADLKILKIKEIYYYYRAKKKKKPQRYFSFFFFFSSLLYVHNKNQSLVPTTNYDKFVSESYFVSFCFFFVLLLIIFVWRTLTILTIIILLCRFEIFNFSFNQPKSVLCHFW